MSEQIAQWYEEQAKETGMSQSNLMVMALHQFMTTQKSLEMANIMKDMMSKLDDQNTEK